MRKKALMTAGIIGALVLSTHLVQAKAKKEINGLVNINTANLTELMLLPGIGKSKAQAIIDYRSQKPFKDTDELMEVRGIGERMYASLKPHLTVSSPTTATVVEKVKSSKNKPGGAGRTK